MEISPDGVVDQFSSNSGNNQQWQISPTDSGYYTITSRSTGNVLDVSGGSHDNGAVILQYPKHGGPNQQWQFVPTDNGYFQIINRDSGKVADVKEVSTANGAGIWQWEYAGGLNQQWKLVAVGSVASDQLDTSVYYQITNRNSGKALEVANSSTADGGPTDQSNYTGAINQQWQLVQVDTGYYEMVNRNSGKVLDVAGISVDNGAILQQWHYLGGKNQQWQIQTADTGYYKIVSRNTGKVAAVAQSSMADGGTVVQYDYHDGWIDQQWQLSPVGSIAPQDPGNGTGSSGSTGSTTPSSSPSTSSLAKEFIYFNGRVMAIENSHYTIVSAPPTPAPPPPSVTVEVPTSQQQVSAGTVTFSGYVLDKSAAVAKVSAQIDDLSPQMTTFIGRPDVCAAHTDAQGCPNVGWSVLVNTAALSMNATHTLKVIADDGHQSGTATVSFSVVNPIRLDIDVPSTQSPAFAGMATFGGWVIDDVSAIANVSVWLDNGPPQNATYGIFRPDVCNAYPNRAGCPNVGWSFNVNTASLSNTTHILHVAATSSDGANFTAAPVSFSVNNQPYTFSLDELGSGTLNADPMPPTSNGFGMTTLVYSSQASDNEVHIGSPDGPLLTYGGPGKGYGPTGAWVFNGETFFLQDVSDNKPLTVNHTMATYSASVRPNGIVFEASANPIWVSDGTGLGAFTLNYNAPGISNITVTVGSSYQTLCGGGSSGSCATGKWVTNGMQFFLHTTPNGVPPSASNVISRFVATVIDYGAPGFVLTAAPRAVPVGGTFYPTLQLQSANGFAGAISLSAAGIPASSSLTFSSNNLTPSTQTTMTVTTPLSTRWSYVTLSGQSGGIQQNDTLELQNWPPQITGYNTGTYNAGTVTLTVNATDAEADLAYTQINIQGPDNQGICAAAIAFDGVPSLLPNANANGACSIASTAPASGNGRSGSFTITVRFDSSRFFGPKNVSAFVVEQSGINTSQALNNIFIPQNQ